MNGPRQRQPAAIDRLGRAAGLAGLAAPVLWVVAAAIEVSRSNIGHSLISRPERLFSDAAWHLAIVAIVTALVVAELAASLTLVARFGARRALAVTAGVLFGVAGLSRLTVALSLPGDPGGYTIPAAAALAADMAVAVTPVAMLVTAAALRRRSPGLAWVAAGAALAMAAVAPWAMVWAARSGASEPQLLAVEPVEGLCGAWSAVVGARLIGGPDWFGQHVASRPDGPAGMTAIPSPGRKSAVLVALALVAVIVGAAAPFVESFRPVIASQLAGRTQVERIHADAVDRTYRVYRPAVEAARPGLVLVLHGSFGGGFQMETMTGFDAQADRLGWVAVYPDGVADGWDAFGSGPTWGRHPGADDIAFIRVLIDHFETTDSVDPDSVDVTGLSRGGMMSYRLGCELSGTIAAIAPVSGNMATSGGSADVPCSLAAPVSILAVHGTADGTIPIAGGMVDIRFSPLADVVARWRSMDACGAAAATSTAGGATTTAWSCSGGSAVVTRIIDGGCHCWPGDASTLIADFFAAHPRVSRE